MSVRVSRSNRVAQPASPGIRAPGLQKLSLNKGVPALTWPVLAPSSTTTDAATGDLIGTLSLGTFGFPRLAPSATTTDAATGAVIGSLSV